MRLFLASEHYGPDEQVFINFIGKRNKVGIIANAADKRSSDARTTYVNEIKNDLKRMNLKGKEIDLRKYKKDNSKLLSDLKELDAALVAGGNTFVLIEAMVSSGFDKIIKELLRKNEIVYAGWSAGAIAATPTLRGGETMDEPHLADKITWEGLGLVEYLIIPHYDSVKYGERAKEFSKQLIKSGTDFRTLNDDEVIIVEKGSPQYTNIQSCNNIKNNEI